MSKVFKRFASIIDERLLRHIPGQVTMEARLSLLRMLGAEIPRGVIIGTGTRIIYPPGLKLGHNVSIARDVVLDARGGLDIEDGALIGFESILLSSTHESGDVSRPVHHQGMYKAPVRIGKQAWLGARCIVMPGAKIGAHVIVGSASVVTKQLDESQIYAGSPARRIRAR